MKLISITLQGDTDKVYTIDTDPDGEARCSCPSFIFSGGVACKHMRFVADLGLQAVKRRF